MRECRAAGRLMQLQSLSEFGVRPFSPIVPTGERGDAPAPGKRVARSHKFGAPQSMHMIGLLSCPTLLQTMMPRA